MGAKAWRPPLQTANHGGGQGESQTRESPATVERAGAQVARPWPALVIAPGRNGARLTMPSANSRHSRADLLEQ